MRTLKSTTSTSTVVVTNGESATAPAAAAAMQRSPWHSPVPYLFGGLAAMLGLIAFALLILACSYWKLSGQMNGDNNNEENDDEKKGDGKGKGRVVFEEQFVVIMAGDDKPTCLAMPVSSKSAKLFSYENDAINNVIDDEKTAADQSGKAQSLNFEEEDVHLSIDVNESNMNSEQSNQLHLHQHQTVQEPESSSSS